MCKIKMEHKKTCGGKHNASDQKVCSLAIRSASPLAIKDLLSKLEVYRQFQELLQVLFPRECANMHSHSEMYTKGFLNLISGFESSTQ